MRRFIGLTGVVLAATAATLVLLCWPSAGGEFSRGGRIHSGGYGSAAEVGRWTHYGLVPYLTIRDDSVTARDAEQPLDWPIGLTIYDRRGADRGRGWFYLIRTLPAGVTTVLVVAVWVAAAGLIRRTRPHA